ncbi:MAG: hypothetical protein IKP12_07505 [Acholeplasmatales bacterium]|nr:hypothetical protein [Acholeplasmatales bacterium]
MFYKSYQHIEKLGTSETEGILKGEVHLSYKIDGSNGCIYLKDNGELGFGSRKRELSITEDNMGFMTSFVTDKSLYSKFEEILKKNPNFIIYGEWLVPVTIKRYGKDAWKKFYVFDVFNNEDGTYLPFNNYKEMLDEYGLLYIPEIAVLNDPSEEDIKEYLDKTGEFLITEGLGEGIVIKNYDYKNKYGRRTWAKILTEDFKKNKKELRKRIHIAKNEGDIELLIVNYYLTSEHVLKEKYKIEEKYGGWSSKNIFELLNRVYDEFLKDNFELILKRYKDPTINFKLLRQYSNDFVKEIIGV